MSIDPDKMHALATDLEHPTSEPAAMRLTPEEEQQQLEADPDFGVCDRCGGEGFIEYADGDGGDWGEDCPSEENHLITCRQCHGTGKV